MDSKQEVHIEPSDATAFGAALRTTAFLAEHAVRDNIKPISDEIFTGAHGDLIYLKICAALAEGSTGVKIQALDRTCDLVRKGDNIAPAIENGVFTELVISLGDWDAKVRQLGSLALTYITESRQGREFSHNEDTLNAFSKLLNDADDGVKFNGYTIFMNLSADDKGVAAILDFNLIEKFILKILQEKDVKVQVKCLEVLGSCIKYEKGSGFQKAMEQNVVQTLKVVLGGAVGSAELQAVVCKVFAYIAYNQYGKDAIVEAGAVPTILHLLTHKSVAVRIAASSAMSYITIALSGKVVVVDDAKGITTIVQAIQDSVELVCVSSVQALANVAEHPKAKSSTILQSEDVLNILMKLSESPNPLVHRAAKLCLSKILNKP